MRESRSDATSPAISEIARPWKIQGNLRERFCGTSHWLAMPARLNFLTASPARLECFAEAP